MLFFWVGSGSEINISVGWLLLSGVSVALFLSPYILIHIHILIHNLSQR